MVERLNLPDLVGVDFLPTVQTMLPLIRDQLPFLPWYTLTMCLLLLTRMRYLVLLL